MKTLLLALSICVGASVACPHSAMPAESYLIVTDCDSVELSGTQYTRVTFSVTNLDAPRMYNDVMHPIGFQSPDDTCHVLVAAGPAGWDAAILFDGGVDWSANSEDDLISYGSSLRDLQVVLNRSMCRYRVSLWGGLQLTPFAQFDVDFGCDQATPAVRLTWGRLKHQYH